MVGTPEVALIRLVTCAWLALLGQVSFAANEQFLVEAELWIDGQQLGTPSLQMTANSPASVSASGDDEGYKLEVMVEPVTDHYAPENTVWLHVEVHQKLSGQWDSLADSLLGVREGETATFSLVEGEQVASPDTAEVYLRISAHRVEPEAEPES